MKTSLCKMRLSGENTTRGGNIYIPLEIQKKKHCFMTEKLKDACLEKQKQRNNLLEVENINITQVLEFIYFF